MELIHKIHKTNHWWIPVLTGAALVTVSIIFMTRPVSAFLGFALVFGWLIFLTGIMNTVFAIRNRKFFYGWVWYLMIGIFEVLIGAAMLFQPQLSAQSLIFFTGFWLMFTSVSRISFSLVLKKLEVSTWWVTLVSSILTVLLSFLIIIYPVIGILSIVYLISFPLLVTGIIAILFGFQLKFLNGRV